MRQNSALHFVDLIVWFDIFWGDWRDELNE